MPFRRSAVELKNFIGDPHFEESKAMAKQWRERYHTDFEFFWTRGQGRDIKEPMELGFRTLQFKSAGFTEHCGWLAELAVRYRRSANKARENWESMSRAHSKAVADLVYGREQRDYGTAARENEVLCRAGGDKWEEEIEQCLNDYRKEPTATPAILFNRRWEEIRAQQRLHEREQAYRYFQEWSSRCENILSYPYNSTLKFPDPPDWP